MRQLVHIAAAMIIFAPAAGVAATESNTQLSPLEAAAQQGDPKAKTELAARYENAEGVPKDFQEANRLYCQAARQGYAEAQFKLGWAYANGRGVAHDDSVAAALFRMAADQGHEYAARLLHYVREQPDTQLPPCLRPDSRVAVARGPGTIQPEDSALGAPQRREIEQLVHRLAPQYAVDSKLALAMIAAESAFNAAAVSPKNAQGLMQLIPETAARFGVKRVFNPVENIRGGLAYLRWLLAFFQGDVPLVIAAYNAGERAVEKYRGIPPYAETRSYVKRVTSVYRKTRHPYQAGIVEPSPIVAR